MDWGRYAIVGVGAIGALILAALTMRKPGQPTLSMPRGGWSFVLAFMLFVGIDLATGQALTSARDPRLGAVGLLAFLTVTAVALAMLVRRTRPTL